MHLPITLLFITLVIIPVMGLQSASTYAVEQEWQKHQMGLQQGLPKKFHGAWCAPIEDGVITFEIGDTLVDKEVILNKESVTKQLKMPHEEYKKRSAAREQREKDLRPFNMWLVESEKNLKTTYASYETQGNRIRIHGANTEFPAHQSISDSKGFPNYTVAFEYKGPDTLVYLGEGPGGKIKGKPITINRADPEWSYRTIQRKQVCWSEADEQKLAQMKSQPLPLELHGTWCLDTNPGREWNYTIRSNIKKGFLITSKSIVEKGIYPPAAFLMSKTSWRDENNYTLIKEIKASGNEYTVITGTEDFKYERYKLGFKRHDDQIFLLMPGSHGNPHEFPLVYRACAKLPF